LPRAFKQYHEYRWMPYGLLDLNVSNKQNKQTNKQTILFPKGLDCVIGLYRNFGQGTYE